MATKVSTKANDKVTERYSNSSCYRLSLSPRHCSFDGLFLRMDTLTMTTAPKQPLHLSDQSSRLWSSAAIMTVHSEGS